MEQTESSKKYSESHGVRSQDKNRIIVFTNVYKCVYLHLKTYKESYILSNYRRKYWYVSTFGGVILAAQYKSIDNMSILICRVQISAEAIVFLFRNNRGNDASIQIFTRAR